MIDDSFGRRRRCFPGRAPPCGTCSPSSGAGTSYNVIGMVEGSDPALRTKPSFFSAHYDHDGEWDGNIYQGADDNGSGTVGVIELARAFARIR